MSGAPRKPHPALSLDIYSNRGVSQPNVSRHLARLKALQLAEARRAGTHIFGIGWDIVRYCPGSALAALTFGATGTVLFVLAMIVGTRVEPIASRPLNQATTVKD